MKKIKYPPKPHFFISIGLSAMLIVTLSKCQKDFEIERKNLKQDATSEVMTLKYEVETLTIPILQNPDEANSQEKIQAMMFSDKSKVEMTLFKDGTTRWQMETVLPSHDLSVQHLTPAGKEPKAKFTRIDRKGMGSFYDENEVLLYTHQVPVPSFADVVANLKENPNAIFAAMGIDTKANLNQILANAKAKGYTIQDLGNGMISVRMANSGIRATATRQSGSTDSNTIVNIFNTSLGIMIGSTLYNEQEEIISQAFYSYELNGQERLVPKAFYMQNWDIDPVTREKTKTETHTFFENVSVTLNQL